MTLYSLECVNPIYSDDVLSDENENLLNQLLMRNRQVYADSLTKVFNRRYCDDRLRRLSGEYALAMDVMMPVMNVYKATRVIRQMSRPDAKTIPILAMSANAFSDDIRQSLAAGMNEHLSKPIEEGKLLAAMARLLGKDEKAAR